ncbi:MAG TPA: hypothetical protein VHF22_06280, partial [Planctomycetota bacterium]|nr:hypothetical protein [Planctomycetota bacterium]
MRVLAVILGVALLAGEARAATYFHPELTHRPRLGFDGRDPGHVARLVAHVSAQEQPWAATYAAIRDRAERGAIVPYGSSGWDTKPDKWAVLYGQEATNGQVAAAKAAVAWLYSQGLDPAWRPLPHLAGEATPAGWAKAQAAQAARTIEGMYPSWPCYKGNDVIDRGIVAADELASHCEAYDLLAALPASLRPSLAAAEKRIGGLAADLNFYYFTVDVQKNNHSIRVASALGLAGLTINTFDEYRWWNPATAWKRPAAWVAKAEDNLHPSAASSVLCYQTSTGAYAEGTSYYDYAADLYLPFFFAYDRFLSGAGVPFLRSDGVTNVARWSLDLRLPDGRRPAVDNATVHADFTPGYFLSRAAGGARSAADQAAFLWDFDRQGHPGMTGARAISMLAAFDPAPSVVQAAAALASPWGAQPTRFLDAQGAAVLRSGAGAADAYALVDAQHGDVRTRGAGHESVENGAYTFFARGDFVTIDPGYPGFTDVAKVNKGEQRSMVL